MIFITSLSQNKTMGILQFKGTCSSRMSKLDIRCTLVPKCWTLVEVSIDREREREEISGGEDRKLQACPAFH